MARQKGEWSCGGHPPRVIFGPNDVSFYKSLGKFAPVGIQISVCYHVRNELMWKKDDSYSDDYIKIKLSKKVKITNFIHVYLEGMLSAFGAYKCDMGTAALYDFRLNNPKEQSGEVINLRRQVPNLSLINFWDNALCMQAFGCDSDVIARGMQGKVELVKKVNDGVLLVITTNPIDVKGEMEICESVMRTVRKIAID
jgi:hypothetical protein